MSNQLGKVGVLCLHKIIGGSFCLFVTFDEQPYRELGYSTSCLGVENDSLVPAVRNAFNGQIPCTPPAWHPDEAAQLSLGLQRVLRMRSELDEDITSWLLGEP